MHWTCFCIVTPLSCRMYRPLCRRAAVLRAEAAAHSQLLRVPATLRMTQTMKHPPSAYKPPQAIQAGPPPNQARIMHLRPRHAYTARCSKQCKNALSAQHRDFYLPCLQRVPFFCTADAWDTLVRGAGFGGLFVTDLTALFGADGDSDDEEVTSAPPWLAPKRLRTPSPAQLALHELDLRLKMQLLVRCAAILLHC